MSRITEIPAANALALVRRVVEPMVRWGGGGKDAPPGGGRFCQVGWIPDGKGGRMPVYYDAWHTREVELPFPPWMQDPR